MSSSTSSRASRALSLEVALSEISSSGDRFLLATQCIETLNEVSSEVGVYGNVLRTLSNHLRSLIFCRDDYTIIPQKNVKVLSSLILPVGHNNNNNNNNTSSSTGALHNKPFYEITEQLVNSLIMAKGKLKQTKEMLRASLEQRKMVVAEKESIARTLRQTQYELKKSKEIERRATTDLREERRETKKKEDESIHGEALIKRELNAMKNTIDKGKDQIRRLLEYRSKVEGIRVTFKMFGSDGQSDYEKHYEPRRSIMQLEMLMRQLKMLYDEKLKAYETVRWDTTRSGTYIEQQKIEFAQAVSKLNYERKQIQEQIPTLSSKLDKKEERKRMKKKKKQQQDQSAKEDIINNDWNHPLPTFPQLLEEFNLMFNNAYSAPVTVVSAVKGMYGGTNYDRYVPLENFMEQHFNRIYGDDETGQRACNAYLKCLDMYKDKCELLMLYYKALNGTITSHVWRMMIEMMRITKSCEPYFDLGKAKYRREFLKRLYVGDVPVSNIFRIIDQGNRAFQKRFAREIDGIKFTNREIIIEWYAHMFCNRVDPRTISFINEVQDRDLSMATSMRLEHFHDVCTALLPTSVKRQETTMYFRAMAYESIVKTFGAVGDGSKGDGAFAKLMARPVTFSRLAESMTLLKLKTMDFTKDLRSEKEKHENEMEDNETMLEQDSLFDELNDDKRRESVFMHMAMADLPEDVDNGEWNC